MSEILANRRSADPEGEAKWVARAVLAECIQNARASLGTVENVVRGMSDLGGRKVVVLVSDGFLTGLGVEWSAAFDIRRITDAGTRAGGGRVLARHAGSGGALSGDERFEPDADRC